MSYGSVILLKAVPYPLPSKDLEKGEKPSGTLISSVQPLSHGRLFAIPWTAARQASLSVANSQSLLKLVSIILILVGWRNHKGRKEKRNFTETYTIVVGELKINQPA